MFFFFCFSVLLKFSTVNMDSFSLLKRKKVLKYYWVEGSRRGCWSCLAPDLEACNTWMFSMWKFIKLYTYMPFLGSMHIYMYIHVTLEGSKGRKKSINTPSFIEFQSLIWHLSATSHRLDSTLCIKIKTQNVHVQSWVEHRGTQIITHLHACKL